MSRLVQNGIVTRNSQMSRWRSGRVVMEPRFDRAERFSEGLAPVVLDGKQGYVDRAGRMALVPEQEPDGPVHRRF